MNSVIEEKYLKAGMSIREESKSALKMINIEEKKLKKINENISKITFDLEELRNNLTSSSNIDEIKNTFFEKMKDIENESIKLNKALDPLNKKMEKLKKEEIQLWNVIREKYPDLEEEDIIQEFKKYIK